MRNHTHMGNYAAGGHPSSTDNPGKPRPHPRGPIHLPIHNFPILDPPILLAQSTLIDQLPHTNDRHPVGRETLWKQLERGPALGRGRPVGDKYEICCVLSARIQCEEKAHTRVLSSGDVYMTWWLSIKLALADRSRR